MAQTSSPRDTVQSVTRALDVLEIVAGSRDSVGITEIAEQSSLPLPTIHRLLRTLTAAGYVYQTPRRRYAPGVRLIPLARHAGGMLNTTLRPLLARTVETVRESVSVAVLDHDSARYVAHMSSDRSLRMFTEVGNLASLYATGVGKAILAAMSTAESEEIIARLPLVALTPNTITNAADLRAELDRVRLRGYAIDDNEQETGVRCVAMAIPGNPLLAASISAPASRVTADVVTKVAVPALRTLVDSVSEVLGASDAW